MNKFKIIRIIRRIYNEIKIIIKQTFCTHKYEFYKNLYSEDITRCKGKRSLWICKKCGMLESRDYFYHQESK